jgi:putative ABC transport system permease protein
VLGVFGLVVAVVGMIGVFSYAVRQRTREIGIRVALGASGRDVIRLVLASSSRAVLVGLGAGAIGAITASQILRRALYGLSPFDPVAYGSVVVLLAAAALAASYLPARRALKIDPVTALRYD